MAKLQLENQQFGFWKVLSKNEEVSKEKKQSYWNCQCQLCKETYTIRGSALTSGKSTKCSECSRHQVTTNEIGNKYEKLEVIANAGTKNNRKMWLCKCQCNNLIEVSTTDLRNGSVKSCGRCPERETIGEHHIRLMLLNAKIPFEQEYVFDDLVYETGHKPKFDFYIPSKNYIIEYDGKQHFVAQETSSWNTEKNLKLTQKRDNIKNNYCFENCIKIIRIPYTVKLSELTIFDLIPETSPYVLKRKE